MAPLAAVPLPERRPARPTRRSAGPALVSVTTFSIGRRPWARRWRSSPTLGGFRPRKCAEPGDAPTATSVSASESPDLPTSLRILSDRKGASWPTNSRNRACTHARAPYPPLARFRLLQLGPLKPGGTTIIRTVLHAAVVMPASAQVLCRWPGRGVPRSRRDWRSRVPRGEGRDELPQDVPEWGAGIADARSGRRMQGFVGTCQFRACKVRRIAATMRPVTPCGTEDAASACREAAATRGRSPRDGIGIVPWFTAALVTCLDSPLDVDKRVLVW